MEKVGDILRRMTVPADAEYNDYPLGIIMASMQKRADEGALTFFKWTCGGCGERVTANDPNTVLTKAKHEERADGSPCGFVTDCEQTGGNFMFILRAGRMLISEADLFAQADEDHAVDHGVSYRDN